ncbi:ribbon-helix-helix protein, CopG family [Desulfosudis oleivorans]|uniref:CopG domain protein DNA-binding domain protein n=1 Tax=Desulfosudis oleivorans (strain DSM 6200 / JCM 39069 / Hxd3) TaxID=96561 RepID=A8ZVF9_DESOH|nr:ribbon-helix-helix protein, CopG family [Desulfosudis oleivorans]ABW68146.1 CopG domain protein DNA-binding domain protein [Desulfosudis oleivorans Hxd3]
MIRTQIYLTEKQRNQLNAIAKVAGKNQSELIREAIDNLIGKTGGGHRASVLRQAAGIWKDRTDLPDFDALREEWNRN